MLHNPSRELELEVKTIESLLDGAAVLDWLSKQDLNTRFCYMDNDKCFCCQYLQAHGFTVRANAWAIFYKDAEIDIPRNLGMALTHANLESSYVDGRYLFGGQLTTYGEVVRQLRRRSE